MTDIVLVPVTGGSNLSAINSNFDKIEEAVNTDILHLKGGNNVMKQDLDLNGHQLLNHDTDLTNPDSLINVGDADARYYNVSGDTLAGNMNAAGNKILNLPVANAPHEPMRKNEVDTANAAQDAITAANNSKTIRTNDAIAAMSENAATRKDKLLSFDNSGNPVAIAAANQSATDLELRLANTADPLKGASLVGFSLSPTAGFVARTVRAKLQERVSVKDFGAVGDGVADDTLSIQAALTAVAAAGGGKVFVPKGSYKVTAPVFLESVSKVSLVGEEGSVVFKDSTFPADGYIYYTKFSDDMSVEGLTFIGKTSSTTAIAFGDHGVGFFSCNRSRVTKNRFKNLGDGAVVVASYTLSSPPSAVDHYGSLVADNFFENCFQTSTTPGGTAGMIFARNNASNLKGSFKFASRLPGAENLVVVDNIVNSASAVSSAVGIEMSSYSNVLISGNELNNCPSVGITCYTNTFAGVAGFQWKNLKIVNNTLRNVAVGIRVSNDAYPDASRFVLESCDISGNTIDTASSFGVLVVNGAFSGLSVNQNTIYRTTNFPISIELLCLNSLSLTDSLQVRDNIIRDCTALGPFIRPSLSSDRLLVSASVDHNLLRNTGAFSLERISELDFTNNTANLLGSLAVTDCVNVSFLDNRIVSTAIALNILATGANVARNKLTGTTASFRTAVGASAINERDNIFSGPLVFNVQPVGESSLGAKRRHLGTAAPTSGAWLQGEIVWNSAPVTGSVVGFVCTASGTPGTWRPFSWTVNRGATGSRPVLTASDIGVMYMDNTLDADGKPIWWNGTAWVDATGAVV